MRLSGLKGQLRRLFFNFVRKSYVEEQLKKHPEFIRCHRTTIINTKYILKLVSGYQGYRLIIHEYDKEVPVSRQYLLRVKEILEMA